jgi:hypothetical protein
MAYKPRDYSIDKSALKALVAVYGPREAARQAGIPSGTVTKWASRYKWKKAVFIKRGTGDQEPSALAGKDAGDLLKEALENHRESSTLHLAQYTANASKKAAEHRDPLEVARKVRDVAGVYQTLWPLEEQSGLIEGAILIGGAKVSDDTVEMAQLIKDAEVDDVRQELPDQGSAGH